MSSPLGPGDTAQGGEEFQVNRSDVGHHAHVGPGDATQPGDFSGGRHPELHNGNLVLRLQLKQRERQSVVVVEIPMVPENLEPAGQQVAGDILGGGLADASRDPDQGLPPTAAHPAGQLLKRLQRVFHQDTGCPCCRPHCLLAAEDQQGGSFAHRFGNELVAIESRPLNGDKAVPGLQGSGIDGIARRQRLPAGRID